MLRTGHGRHPRAAGTGAQPRASQPTQPAPAPRVPPRATMPAPAPRAPTPRLLPAQALSKAVADSVGKPEQVRLWAGARSTRGQRARGARLEARRHASQPRLRIARGALSTSGDAKIGPRLRRAHNPRPARRGRGAAVGDGEPHNRQANVLQRQRGALRLRGTHQHRCVRLRGGLVGTFSGRGPFSCGTERGKQRWRPPAELGRPWPWGGPPGPPPTFLIFHREPRTGAIGGEKNKAVRGALVHSSNCQQPSYA
jgi:hypothetical protein